MIQNTARKITDYLVRDLPPFAAALLTAEFFFRFGSFTLECLAFLALWWGLAQIYRRVQQLLGILLDGAVEGSQER